MSTFEWLEKLRLAQWVGESLWGYPLILTLHALGLAVVVGLNVVLCLRFIGAVGGIGFTSLRRMLKIAWLGFTVNLASGCLLFIAEATKFVASVPFLLKITFIALAGIATVVLQRLLDERAAGWDRGEALPGRVRRIAGAALVLWGGAIVAGRLIAYF
jgi:hypothetical protein